MNDQSDLATLAIKVCSKLIQKARHSKIHHCVRLFIYTSTKISLYIYTYYMNIAHGEV